jgi:hypothetical protein
LIVILELGAAERFVTGHGLSRAEQRRKTIGFSRCVIGA